jgi:hypothetical protein
MDRIIKLIFSVLFIFLLSGTLFSQTTDSTAAPVTPSGSGSDFVDLSQEAVIIKIEPERPRVNIFAERIKPEFDDINLDKSFINELTGKGEKVVVLDDKTNDQFKIIEVEKILNRTR